MIDSIRFDDGLAVSECIDRSGPPADEGAFDDVLQTIRVYSVDI